MKQFLKRGLPVLVLASWAGLAVASPQSFTLPGHGKLLLNAPAEWKSDFAQPERGLPPTIGFHEQSGATFVIKITAVWGTAAGAGALDDATIRRIVASAAKDAESQSVEKSLAVQTLAGSSGQGYYFRATDRAPKPDEWKYLTQGMIRTGAVALAFTILTNDGQAATEKVALEMIRLAVQESGEAV